jgi:hypothetical protein
MFSVSNTTCEPNLMKQFRQSRFTMLQLLSLVNLFFIQVPIIHEKYFIIEMLRCKIDQTLCQQLVAQGVVP